VAKAAAARKKFAAIPVLMNMAAAVEGERGVTTLLKGDTTGNGLLSLFSLPVVDSDNTAVIPSPKGVFPFT